MSVFRVEKNTNYTVISNHHLRDKNLSLKSIGLLSLILSLPENWDYTQAGLAAICKDGLDAVRSSLKELEANGYLVRERDRDEDGKMKGMIYHIFEVPQIERTINPTLENPTMGIPTMDKPINALPTFGKTMQIIKERDNNKIVNKDQSIYLSSGHEEKTQMRDGLRDEIKEKIGYSYFENKYNDAEQKLNLNLIDLLEYENLITSCDIPLINQIVEAILDIVMNPDDGYIQIGENRINKNAVKEKLLRIGFVEMKNTVLAIKTNTVKNPKKYAISMLYNS